MTDIMKAVEELVKSVDVNLIDNEDPSFGNLIASVSIHAAFNGLSMESAIGFIGMAYGIGRLRGRKDVVIEQMMESTLDETGDAGGETTTPPIQN